MKLYFRCATVKSRYIGDGHHTFNRNPYNRYINPYYWVDDHPLLYGNNGSLDPGTDHSFCFCYPPENYNIFVENQWLEDEVSFWNGPFFGGDLLIFRRVYPLLNCIMPPTIPGWWSLRLSSLVGIKLESLHNRQANLRLHKSQEQWKKPWLFRVCRGLYYPVLWRLQWIIIRIPIKQPV